MSDLSVVIRERQVDRGRYRLQVYEIGTDVPILLLHHGLGCAKPYVGGGRNAIGPALAARGCRVLAMDLLGHGLSTAIPSLPPDYLDLCVADAVAVLDAFGIPQVTVLGSGFGGLVALKMGAAAAQRVTGVVADSVPGFGDVTEPWKHLKKGLKAPPEADWETFLRTHADAHAIVDSCSQLEAPTLLLAASSKGPQAAGLFSLARNLPHASVSLVPTERPPAALEAPGFFLRESERFLAAYA